MRVRLPRKQLLKSLLLQVGSDGGQLGLPLSELLLDQIVLPVQELLYEQLMSVVLRVSQPLLAVDVQEQVDGPVTEGENQKKDIMHNKKEQVVNGRQVF